MMSAFGTLQPRASLAVLAVCLACGSAGARAGVETVRASGVVWLRGGTASASKQSSLGRISLPSAQDRISGRQSTSPAGDVSLAPSRTDGMPDILTAPPHGTAEDATAVPFIGAPGTLAAFGGRPAPNLGDRPRSLSDMAPVLPVVEQAAADHRLDPALLLAVIHAESGFNPQALSPKGAVGLMQLMPATASRYGTGDLRDPGRNVQAGAAHLRYLLGRYDDLPLALAAYNAGENAVERYGMRIPPYAETQDYVPRVLSLYRKYQHRTDANQTAAATTAQERTSSVRSVLTTWPVASRAGGG